MTGAAAPEYAFNIFDPDVKADPYPHYAEMRDVGRVVSNPMLLGQFMVPGYDDVATLLSDATSFSIEGVNLAIGGRLLKAQTMLFSDPPEHERLREPVGCALTPKHVALQEEWIYEAAREMVAPLRDGEDFEVVDRVAQRLPALVIARMLGVSSSDLDDFISWSHGLLGGALDIFASGEQTTRSTECAESLRDYFAAEVDRRADRPSEDDLVGRLLMANVDGRLTRDEMYAACILLLLGGNETTTKLITNSVLALARHPQERARLAGDMTLLPSAVEELLRFDTPVQGDIRVAREEMQFAGFHIPKGAALVALLGAANHDPVRFVCPESLDLGRQPNPVLSFGRGLHFCLGSHLARIEARMALKAFIEAAPEYELSDPEAPLVYDSPTFFFRGPGRLTVRKV